MDPINHLRDSVTWPVLPVTPSLPVRKAIDLEPFNPPENSVDSYLEQASVFVGDDGGGRLCASALMHREVITISPEKTVIELEALLQRHRISGVPVTDPKTQELLGVVSQVDIARHLGKQSDFGSGAPGFYQSLWPQAITCLPSEGEVPVSAIMTPFVYFATEDASLLELLDLMLGNHIHRVVITRERRLVGVVTSMDLLQHMRSELQS